MRNDILKPAQIIMVLICAVSCCIGLASPVGVAVWLACVVLAIAFPLSVPRDKFDLKNIVLAAGKLSVIGLPACFTTALGAEVGFSITVIFALSAFIPLLYILMTTSLIRISIVGKQPQHRLFLLAIGHFALLLIPSLLLASSYNCSSHDYFCYEKDQFLVGIDLGYYVLPITLALVVAFVIAPILSKHSQLASMGWVTAIYGVCIILWLFFPRLPMVQTDGRNPYYFRLVLGRHDYAEIASKWIILTAIAVVLGWLVSFACIVFRKMRKR